MVSSLTALFFVDPYWIVGEKTVKRLFVGLWHLASTEKICIWIPCELFLETLVKDILGCTFSAHDAVMQTRYLRKVVEHHNIDSFYLQYGFSMRYIIDSIKQIERLKKILHTLMPLPENHIISGSMCKKISF